MEKFVPQDDIGFYCNIDIAAVCRICLEKNLEDDKLCNIFEGSTPLYSMIMSCTAVQIFPDDGLPHLICQKCLAKLNVAWQFKLQCEVSDSRLRQYFANSSLIKISQEPDSFNTIHKTDNMIVEENCNSTKFDNRNVAEIQPKINNNSDDNSNELEDLTNGKTAKISKTTRLKDSKVHQCDTCGKIFNRREYLTQHIRIHTGEKPYCCHICEKRFINSGHLTTHMRTHTGEKPHTCLLCPKAFSTKQELRKHTMVHQGIRPFICATCGKCFGSSSNLYSHLRHHTGEKNFTCEHCGKAFYTKQELKQHLVIHTGEKAFQCEYCNKKFSQIAHLRRHIKLHV